MYNLDFRSKFFEKFLLILNSRQIVMIPAQRLVIALLSRRLLNAIICLTFESRDFSFLLIFFVSRGLKS